MTFKDVWNMVSLHAGSPDVLLCRAWTQWAYNEFCERRAWSHLRAETVITTNVQKTGTCIVTKGSATVTGGTLTFAATDIGRQFRVSSIPIYTIIAVDPAGATTATLERVYSEATTVGSTTAYILDAYVTMPEDFHRFISVLDPANQWRLRFWISQDLLNMWDPGRQSSSNPCLLASQAYSPVPGMTGQPRYELYPYQTGFATYPVWYYRKPENMLDSQEIIGPLARRAMEILLDGALSRCAMWPGTTTGKNPYFSLSLAERHEQLFEKKIQEVTVVDEELYYEAQPLSDFLYADFPWSASWLQSHEPYLI